MTAPIHDPKPPLLQQLLTRRNALASIALVGTGLALVRALQIAQRPSIDLQVRREVGTESYLLNPQAVVRDFRILRHYLDAINHPETGTVHRLSRLLSWSSDPATLGDVKETILRFDQQLMRMNAALRRDFKEAAQNQDSHYRGIKSHAPLYVRIAPKEKFEDLKFTPPPAYFSERIASDPGMDFMQKAVSVHYMLQTAARADEGEIVDLVRLIEVDIVGQKVSLDNLSRLRRQLRIIDNILSLGTSLQLPSSLPFQDGKQ